MKSFIPSLYLYTARGLIHPLYRCIVGSTDLPVAQVVAEETSTADTFPLAVAHPLLPFSDSESPSSYIIYNLEPESPCWCNCTPEFPCRIQLHFTPRPPACSAKRTLRASMPYSNSSSLCNDHVICPRWTAESPKTQSHQSHPPDHLHRARPVLPLLRGLELTRQIHQQLRQGS